MPTTAESDSSVCRSPILAMTWSWMRAISDSGLAGAVRYGLNCDCPRLGILPMGCDTPIVQKAGCSLN